MWKETVVVYFKVLSWHLHGGTEATHGKINITGLCAKFQTQYLPSANHSNVTF